MLGPSLAIGPGSTDLDVGGGAGAPAGDFIQIDGSDFIEIDGSDFIEIGA